jgi:hypothetical protein
MLVARFRLVLSGAVAIVLVFSLFFVPGSFAEPLGSGLLQRFGVRSDTSADALTPPGTIGLPVTVENTSKNPVPVTVQGNTGQPLTATIQGTVTIEDVNDPAAQPFQVELPFEIADNAIGLHSSFLFQVPTGKRLIIRYVSGIFNLGIDQAVNIILQTTAAGVQVNHDIPPAYEESLSTETLVHFGLETWVAADAGEINDIGLDLYGSAPSAGRHGTMTISGYLVDMP